MIKILISLYQKYQIPKTSPEAGYIKQNAAHNTIRQTEYTGRSIFQKECQSWGLTIRAVFFIVLNKDTEEIHLCSDTGYVLLHQMKCQDSHHQPFLSPRVHGAETSPVQTLT